MRNTSLRIGGWMISTEVNGPGRRFVLWLQGCRFACPGCMNRELWDENAGRVVSVAWIQKKILAAGPLDGITFTGGEPMLQAKQLLPLAQWIKSRGLGLISYTGNRYANLLNDSSHHYSRCLLIHVDMLIDGRFQQEQKAELIWRGSSNQKIHFLSHRYRHLQHKIDMRGTRQAELRVRNGELTMTGFFPEELWNRLQARLQKPAHNTSQPGETI